MLSLFTKNVFGRFMTQTVTTNNLMAVRGVASKPNKTAKLKGSLKVSLKTLIKISDSSLTFIIIINRPSKRRDVQELLNRFDENKNKNKLYYIY